jgi:hypothetical protein
MKTEELIKKILDKHFQIEFGKGWYSIKEVYRSQSRGDKFIEKEIWGLSSTWRDGENGKWFMGCVEKGLQDFVNSAYFTES